ncbi:unnamed protein product [Closterium sp. Naga37s-1]|nr:unnamed protein product [Closterium sp. Naga37s-1]
MYAFSLALTEAKGCAPATSAHQLPFLSHQIPLSAFGAPVPVHAIYCSVHHPPHKEKAAQTAAMAVDREANAVAEAVKWLFDLVRGELLSATAVELAALKGEMAAVREENARQNERVMVLEERNQVLESEVNELRRALGVVGEKSEATAAVVEERERELAAVKDELNGVKGEVIRIKGDLLVVNRKLSVVEGELTAVKGSMAELLNEAERKKPMDSRELRGEGRNGEDEVRVELPRDREERRREVQELDWPRAMENWQRARSGRWRWSISS